MTEVEILANIDMNIALQNAELVGPNSLAANINTFIEELTPVVNMLIPIEQKLGVLEDVTIAVLSVVVVLGFIAVSVFIWSKVKERKKAQS